METQAQERIVPSAADLAALTPLVKNAVRGANVNSILSSEDIAQELWCSLVKDWGRFANLEPAERFKWVKTHLKSRVIDLARFYARRPDTSIYAKFNPEMGGDETGGMLGWDDALEGLSEKDIHGGSRFPQPDSAFFGTELIGLLREFVEREDEVTGEFIRNCLSPSEEINAKWEELQAQYPRYSSRRNIPPHTLIKLMGHGSRVYHRINDNLRRFLRDRGYGGLLNDLGLLGDLSSEA
jgi:DNA-directed RNA polymerase specialized sigma24 family protein